MEAVPQSKAEGEEDREERSNREWRRPRRLRLASEADTDSESDKADSTATQLQVSTPLEPCSEVSETESDASEEPPRHSSLETFTSARRRVEQMTQEMTLQAAMASAEILQRTLEGSQDLQRRWKRGLSDESREPTWLLPSTRANYVDFDAEMGAAADGPGFGELELTPKAMAQLAKLASQEAVKASKEGLRVSQHLWSKRPDLATMSSMSSKLWQDAPGRHAVATMSSMLWHDAPGRHAVATMSSRFWEAPGLATTSLATILTGLAPRQETQDDLGADGESTEAVSACLRPVASAVEKAFDGQVSPCAGFPLHCCMLFSSPLCVERVVKVRLPSVGSFASSAEVASWGLAFETALPCVVRDVRPGGRIATWNMQQGHFDAMVRPGDELVHLSASSSGNWARGRAPVAILGDLFAQAEADRSPSCGSRASGAPAAGRARVELVFRGLRSLAPLRVAEEIAALRACGCHVAHCAATVSNIRALVAVAGCRILHMSLHCAVADEPLLFLEDGSGKAHVVRSSELRELLTRGQHQQHIHIAFLNACHSLAVGIDLIGAGVRHVICVRDENDVRDRSCQLFARDFFGALRAGRTVREAFDCGVAILACNQEPPLRCDARAFVLLPLDANHSEIYFPGGAQCCVEPPPPPGGSWGAIPPQVEDLVGREVDVHRMLQHLRSRRFLEVTGERGIGKSSLLAELGRFVQLRREPFEEVRWVDCEDDSVRRTCEEGVAALRERLADAPQRRVLLLVDDAVALSWAALRAVLRFEGVHVAVATDVEAADAGAGSAPVPSSEAIAAGLKPVRFRLGPLEPLAQARLFLLRASRPLYSSDLGDLGAFSACAADEAPLAARPPPAELIALSETPRLRALGGNPRRIVAAAQGLGPLRCLGGTPDGPPSLPASPRAGAGASTGPGLPSAATTPALSALRRVRLVRPDGRVRNEWLRRGARVAEVLAEYTPAELRGDLHAEAVIMGCRAHPDALLADFPEGEEPLVFEMRAKAEDDW